MVTATQTTVPSVGDRPTPSTAVTDIRSLANAIERGEVQFLDLPLQRGFRMGSQHDCGVGTEGDVMSTEVRLPQGTRTLYWCSGCSKAFRATE